jgi:acyl carrier protein
MSAEKRSAMSDSTMDALRTLVAATLGIENRVDALTENTALADMPEFDSMAVLEVISAVEKRFSIVVEDDEVTGDVFETLGALAAFVDGKLK